jgi:hypothetical protein
VWAKPLSTGSWAVILYNPNFFEYVDVYVAWTQIRGWPVRTPPLQDLHHASVGAHPRTCLGLGVQAMSKKALVRDLWLHEDQGVWAAGYMGKAVAPHAVRFLIATPTTN